MEPRTDRIEITYQLQFTTPFHCGTGFRQGLIDRTVVRDSAEYLYVPGSTFKGMLRERCEQLARFYIEETSGETEREEVQEREGEIASPHNMKAALQGLGFHQPTMVTRIFGSQNVPGRLFFDEAHQKDDNKNQYDSSDSNERNGRGKYKNLQVNVYTQVRLNRPTRTAVPGALYTSEFGSNDLAFEGKILGWLECTPIGADDVDAPTYSLLLLLAGLQMIEGLGGNKSTGKGRCSCTINEMKINGEQVAESKWKSWLEQLNALANYDKEGKQ